MGPMRKPRQRPLIVSAIAVWLLSAIGTPAMAVDSSRWDNDTRSAVRLVAARTLVQFGAPIMRAGVEVKLQPGWKTYWRYPGDSGVPPVFDFGGSENIRSVTVLWSAPVRCSDGVGDSIGYKDAVVLPLRVLAKDERKPVMLRLKLDYAVCEQVCVPSKANVELQLSGGTGVSEELMAAAEARVPKLTQIGAGQSL